MSWRRSTLSSRRLAVLIGVGIIGAALVPVALARTAGRAPVEPAAAAETPSDPAATEPASPQPAASATAMPDTAATEESAPRARTRQRGVAITDKELAEARQVAADFAAAYASYRYDESPESAADRLTPWTTAELAQQLAANAGGAAAREALAERRQVAEAQVQTVSVQRVSGREVDLVVVVQQDLSWDGGGEKRWPSYLLRVVRGPDGWRVATLQP